MQRVVIVTGSGGLIGSTVARTLMDAGYIVHGVDDDHRRMFFGENATVRPEVDQLCSEYYGYRHSAVSICDVQAMNNLIQMERDRNESELWGVVHCAAQPSHDWAASDAFADFYVNAGGTLNLLEAMRSAHVSCPFVHMSTNKVYGDVPNYFEYEEGNLRYEPVDQTLWDGFDENLRIDHCTHSLFGCSKLSADMYVQEYGRYFGIPTTVLRGGCLTGAAHRGVELHGFLSYLTKCVVQGRKFRVIGWQGKQVRDNIDARDVASALKCILERPLPGSRVYNLGGGRTNSCSVLEAIQLLENIAGVPLDWSYEQNHRIGDHKWWITNTRKFREDYPEWKQQYSLYSILEDMVNAERMRG